MKTLVALALMTSVVACAGRDPRLIETARSNDQDMTCFSIDVEQDSINSNITRLERESSSTNVYNWLIAGTTLFVPVAIFALDLEDAAAEEAEQYRIRQDVLNKLAANKGC